MLFQEESLTLPSADCCFLAGKRHSSIKVYEDGAGASSGPLSTRVIGKWSLKVLWESSGTKDVGSNCHYL